MSSTVSVLIAIALLAQPAATHAQTYSLVRTLLDPTRGIRGGFASVSFIGNRLAALKGGALAGEPQQTEAGVDDAGAAYLMDTKTGRLIKHVRLTEPRSDDYLGSAVAAVNGNAAIAAPSRNLVFILDARTGAVLRTISNPDPGFQFGASVAAAGSNLLVGFPNALIDGIYAGAVYLFDGTTGALLRTFPNPTPVQSALFGSTVAAAGSDILVSANGTADGGAVYLIEGVNGAVKHTFLDPNLDGDFASFGQPLVAVGHVVAVGDPFDNAAAPHSGAVYLFDMANGTLVKTLYSPTPTAQGLFGMAVVANAGRIFVGAPRDTVPPNMFGAIYIFDGVTGGYIKTIAPSHFARGYGAQLAMMGTNLLVGGSSWETLESLPDAIDVLGASEGNATCGSGIVAGDEQCDDGNSTDGDGCSAGCKLELCGPAPASDCRSPSHGFLITHTSPDGAQMIRWRWSGQGAPADFGDPTTTTSYALCVYDRAGTRLRVDVAAPASGMCGTGLCWQALRSGGFKYGDTEGTPDGLRTLSLDASPLGTATIRLEGRGAHLRELAPGLTDGIRAQLRNTATSACWETRG